LISAEEDGYARAAAALAAKYFGTQQKLDEATVWLDRANVLSLTVAFPLKSSLIAGVKYDLAAVRSPGSEFSPRSTA